jgi:hypothetical protein
MKMLKQVIRVRGVGRFRAGVAVAAATMFAACSDGPTGTVSGPPEPAVNFQRLLVADAQVPHARLLALHNDSVLQTISLGDQPASRVYRSGSGRFAVVQQINLGRVHFVDAGVWAENQTAFRRTPNVLGFQLADGRPSDENVHGDWVSIFFDGSGIIRWVRESELVAGNPRVAFEANSGRPHHGVSMTVVSGGTPFFAHSVPNDAGSPTGVAVRNLQGQIVAQVPVGECPGVHGNSAIAAGGVFGCNNGMVVVRPSGTGVTAQKITLSGDMEGLALRNAYAATGASFIVGQFAAFPGQPAQRVFATIDPASGAVHRLPAFPPGVVDHWRAVEPVKGQIVILGTNGSLFVFNGATRQLQHTVANVVPALPTSGATPHQLAVAEDLAVVPSPTTGEVVLVNLSNGTVIRRVNVGGVPSRLALLGSQVGGQFSPAN